MDARAKSIGDILHAKDQYWVPFFQRFYCWKQQDWERLLVDILCLTAEPQETQHFLGPFVCTPLKSFPAELHTYQIIDGQQRLTTLMVLLAALRDVAKEMGVPHLPDEIEQDYLVHRWLNGPPRYKLIPLLPDREPFRAVIDGKSHDGKNNTGVANAWRFFKERWTALAQTDPQTRLRQVLQAATARLSLVVITIDHENPYEIFESLNGAGQPLEESGLIKNFLFMKVGLENQTAFQEQHWSQLERLFVGDGESPDVPTSFYRDYLMRLGTYSKRNRTFVDFKQQFNERNGRGFTPEAQVAELRKIAQYELWMWQPDKCPDARIKRELREIRMLDMTTAHPLLLNLLERYQAGLLPLLEFVGCMRDLASFVLRRSICDEQTRGYGRWFVEAIKAIHGRPRQNLQDYWSRRGWPDDQTFGASLLVFPLYGSKGGKCRLLLNALEESYAHHEQVDLADSKVQIEHVMPQTIGDDESGRGWKLVLGGDWERVHNQLLHSLGNLTLTAYNLDLSNKSYREKRGIYADSHLSLNHYFANVEIWNEQSIRERGRVLAQKIVGIWPRPPGPYILSTAERSPLEIPIDEEDFPNQEEVGPSVEDHTKKKSIQQNPVNDRSHTACYIEAHMQRLRQRHYVQRAKERFYNFYEGKLERYRTRYGDSFCLVISCSNNRDDAYVLPYNVVRDIYVPEYLRSGRWVGNVREDNLTVSHGGMPPKTLYVRKFHNAFELLQDAPQPIPHKTEYM